MATDTTVPVLAEGKKPTPVDVGSTFATTKPFGGVGAAGGDVLLLAQSPGRASAVTSGGYSGILQADAYDGYGKLYQADRKPAPVREAACWVHARRPFFAMADIEEECPPQAAGKKEICAVAPIAIEVVRRIDALFEIERAINGVSRRYLIPT